MTEAVGTDTPCESVPVPFLTVWGAIADRRKLFRKKDTVENADGTKIRRNRLEK